MPAPRHCGGAFEHLRDRLGKARLIVAVRPAAGKEEPDTETVRRLQHCVVVGTTGVEVLMIDHRGSSGAEVLDDAHRRCSSDLRRGHHRRRRPDVVAQPVEQRLVVPETPEQGLEQMGVPVHHAGHHGATPGSDHLIGRPCRRRGLPGANSHDLVTHHMNPPARMNSAHVIGRDDGSVLDGERTGHGVQPPKASTTERMSSIIGNRIGQVTPASMYSATFSRHS
ncbi:unannotated protein [freshwater metagenome]|uniref:Unannotated protein n=1 Tax=freshwater metagenome TaxID=449393 RepID=A0A6J6Z6V1_9ZZZZ